MSSSGIPANLSNTLTNLQNTKAAAEREYSALERSDFQDGLSGLYYTGNDAIAGMDAAKAWAGRGKEYYLGKLSEIEAEIKTIKAKMDEAKKALNGKVETLDSTSKSIYEYNVGIIAEAIDAATQGLEEQAKSGNWTSWDDLYRAYIRDHGGLKSYNNSSAASGAMSGIGELVRTLEGYGRRLDSIFGDYTNYKQALERACGYEKYAQDPTIRSGLCDASFTNTVQNSNTDTNIPVYTDAQTAIISQRGTVHAIDEESATIKQTGDRKALTATWTTNLGNAIGSFMKTNNLQSLTASSSDIYSYSTDNTILKSLEYLLFGENPSGKKEVQKDSFVWKMAEAGLTNDEILDIISNITVGQATGGTSNEKLFGKIGIKKNEDGSYTIPWGHDITENRQKTGTWVAGRAPEIYGALRSIANDPTKLPQQNTAPLSADQVKGLRADLQAFKDAGFTFKEAIFALDRLHPDLNLGINLQEQGSGSFTKKDGKSVSNYGVNLPKVEGYWSESGDSLGKAIFDLYGDKGPDGEGAGVNYCGEVKGKAVPSEGIDPFVIPSKDGKSNLIVAQKGAESVTGLGGILGSGLNSQGAQDNTNIGEDAWKNQYGQYITADNKITSEEGLKSVLLVKEVQVPDGNGKFTVQRSFTNAWEEGIREINLNNLLGDNGAKQKTTYDANGTETVDAFGVTYGTGGDAITKNASQVNFQGDYANAILGTSRMKTSYKIDAAQVSQIFSSVLQDVLGMLLKDGTSVGKLGEMIEELRNGDGKDNPSVNAMVILLNEYINGNGGDAGNDDMYMQMQRDLEQSVEDFINNKSIVNDVDVYNDVIDETNRYLHNNKDAGALVASDIVGNFRGYLRGRGFSETIINQAVQIFIIKMPTAVQNALGK